MIINVVGTATYNHSQIAHSKGKVEDMKSIHFLLAIVLTGLLLSCAAEKKNKLEGVWERVSATYTSPDTTIEITQADWIGIKVITKSHFVFVGQRPDRPKYSERGSDSEILAAAKAFNAGGGTYTLEGEMCTEHIKYFLNPTRVGTSVPYKCQVDGDQWIQSGIFPSKSLGLADFDWELYEVYKRLE